MSALIEQLNRVPGWLLDAAAYATVAVLESQLRDGPRGPIVEIGVYGGRYLALLANHALKSNDKVVGIDIFTYIDEAQVLKNFGTLNVSTAFLHLVRADSTGLTADGVRSMSGSPPRFISIDGDHAAAAVYRDLRVISEAMADDAIVAIDDFLNPLAFGVNEGVNRFFFDGTTLAPVCYVGGKLFVAKAAHVQRYWSVFESFAQTDTKLGETARYRDLAALSRAYVVQSLFGHEVLVIGDR